MDKKDIALTHVVEGHESDGWNKDELGNLIEFLDRVRELDYEIRNCVMGAYCQDAGDTYKSLVAHLESLSNQLTNVIEEVEGLDDTVKETTDESIVSKLDKHLKENKQ